MARHDCYREHGTDNPDAMGYMDWTRVACSCGWKGRKVHNHNNWKMKTLAEQEREHRKLNQRKSMDTT